MRCSLLDPATGSLARKVVFSTRPSSLSDRFISSKTPDSKSLLAVIFEDEARADTFKCHLVDRYSRKICIFVPHHHVEENGEALYAPHIGKAIRLQLCD